MQRWAGSLVLRACRQASKAASAPRAAARRRAVSGRQTTSRRGLPRPCPRPACPKSSMLCIDTSLKHTRTYPQPESKPATPLQVAHLLARAAGRLRNAFRVLWRPHSCAGSGASGFWRPTSKHPGSMGDPGMPCWNAGAGGAAARPKLHWACAVAGPCRAVTSQPCLPIPAAPEGCRPPGPSPRTACRSR